METIDVATAQTATSKQSTLRFAEKIVGDVARERKLDTNSVCCDNLEEWHMEEWHTLWRGVAQCDFNGVVQAVEHFLKQGLAVVVVTRRPDMWRHRWEGVSVVVAERTDDIVLVKQSHLHNCPTLTAKAQALLAFIRSMTLTATVYDSILTNLWLKHCRNQSKFRPRWQDLRL